MYITDNFFLHLE